MGELARSVVDIHGKGRAPAIGRVGSVEAHQRLAVAVAQGGGFQLSVQVGNRFPALISATGRCIAAFGKYPADELEARCRGGGGVTA